jgi:hypothetical protein
VAEIQLKRKTDDCFGVVTGGHLILKGVLKSIVVVESPRKGYTKYHWQIIKHGKTLDEAYKMIYLDAPASDCPGILGPDGGVFCLPACRDRSSAPQELTCLLLQSVEGAEGTFRRVGLAKISRYQQEDQKEVMASSGDEASIQLLWDPEAQKHTVRII